MRGLGFGLVSLLRNNYVMITKSKWLVFTTTIGDKGLNRKVFFAESPRRSLEVIRGHVRSLKVI